MRKRIVYVSDEDLEIVSDMLLRSYWSDTPEDMITKGLLTQISNMSGQMYITSLRKIEIE